MAGKARVRVQTIWNITGLPPADPMGEKRYPENNALLS